MIFQDPQSSLNERAKVSYIVGEGLMNVRPDLSAAERDEKVRQALLDVGLLPEFASRFPHEFSGGQRQRIGIARALIVEPEFIIADEPSSALDMSIRAQVLNLLRHMQKERGITIVLVSHSMEDVAQYASRILVVNGGKIVFDDQPRKVFEHEKELNEMGLAIPQVTQLMHRLKSEGYPVFENAITVQEARKNLLMYFQGKKKQDCKSKDQNNQDQKSQIESRRKPEEKTV